MNEPSELRTDSTKPRTWLGRIRRGAVAVGAVCGVYIGGFIWEEVSPAAYSVVFIMLASTPLLLKVSFWKKLVLLFPLLIIRVVGKILAQVFGMKAMERLFRRYGLLEQRYQSLLASISESQAAMLARWRRINRTTQAHLIMMFLPFLGLLLVAVLIIKLLRFRLLQMAVEKVLQKSVQEKIKSGVDRAAHSIKKRKSS